MMFLEKLISVLLLSSGFSMLAADVQGVPPSSELKGLRDWIEVQRVEHDIPGMAVVVIKKDTILFMETFGFADAEKETPVTINTVFPIGSCSKPFTSTLAAMLVSDGVIDWDNPVTRYLPFFVLDIRTDNETDQVTIRDLLAHRTGFFTMELVQKAANWQQIPDFDHEQFTRESMLRDTMEFEPKDDFRKKHNYSNVSMLAAALACGKAAGKDWDTLMEERMFEPLGMSHSTTSITQIAEDHNVAQGYLKMEGDREEAMLINMDIISPAGGVNSTLADMALWLRFLLCGGVHEGERLVKEEALRETWSKQIGGADLGGMFPGASYGLGWFITEWKGRKVVEHGGNALGFSANIALMPDEGIGYVMLSNQLPNPLQISLSEAVWNRLLRDIKE